MAASSFFGRGTVPPLPVRAARFALSALLATGIGCEKSPEPSSSGKRTSPAGRRRDIILFVGAGREDPIWPILEAGARRYTARNSLIAVRFVNPRGQTPQDQIDCLRELDVPDMRGLCIQVIDVKAVRPILERLRTRGIRIVSMVNPLPLDLRNGHVGFDDREIGTMLARATAQALNDAGPIALLQAGYEHPLCGPRLIGFEEQLRAYPQLDLFTSIDCHAVPQEARREMAEFSARFPRLKAWVSLDDWPLRERGGEPIPMPAGCKLITFGGTPRQWPLIADGLIGRAVAADYGDMGFKALQFCELALRDSTPYDRRFNAPLRTISAADLDEYKAEWAKWSGAPTTQGQPGP